MGKDLNHLFLQKKKGEITLKQIAIIILAIVVAGILFYLLKGIRNAVLPK